VSPRARILRGDQATVLVTPLLERGAGPAERRRIAREELEAKASAAKTLRDAAERAEAIVAKAKSDAQAAAAEVVRQAREAADTQLTARWLALRDAERRRVEKDADRIVPVAVALAERLVGAALELEPDRVARLAAAVLAEARGARRAVVDAHPLDAEALRRAVGTAGLDACALEIRSDESLARGALRLQTDVGTIDAQLAPRLERLADALRDALG
jgi:flagellar biosynthesis/type III secretory pathway protein FliH